MSPRVCETITKYGVQAASDCELLSALGFSTTDGETLKDFTKRAHASKESSRLESLQEIMRRWSRTEKNVRINSPRGAGEYLLWHQWDAEKFGLLALNAKGDLLGDRILSMGTCTGTLVSPREFFREALAMGATTAIAYHNHPSGDPAPSREDQQLTRRLRVAGDALGVPLADHIIIGKDSYHSFRATEAWDQEEV